MGGWPGAGSARCGAGCGEGWRGVGGGLACGGARSRNSERGRSRRGSDKRRPRWRGTPPLHLLLWRQFPAVAGPSPPPLPCCSRQLLDPKNRCCCFPRLCSAEGDEEEGSGSGQRFWKESEGGKEKDAAAASPSLLPSLVARGNCLTPKTGAAVSRVSGRIKRGPSSKAPTSTSVLCRQSERARPATTRATLLTNGLFLSCSLSLSLSLSHLSCRRKNRAVCGFRETKLQESSLFSLSRSRPPLEKNTYLICTTSSRPAMGATGLPATRDCRGMSVDLETEAKNGAAREVRDRETNRRLKRNDSLLSLSLSPSSRRVRALSLGQTLLRKVLGGCNKASPRPRAGARRAWAPAPRC